MITGMGRKGLRIDLHGPAGGPYAYTRTASSCLKAS